MAAQPARPDICRRSAFPGLASLAWIVAAAGLGLVAILVATLTAVAAVGFLQLALRSEQARVAYKA